MKKYYSAKINQNKAAIKRLLAEIAEKRALIKVIEEINNQIAKKI